MDKISRPDITFEGNTAIWEINATGSVNGTYIGLFKFRAFLTPMQKLAASREYRELLGDNPTLALKHEDDLAFSLSQLKQRIISAPPFWTATLSETGMAGDLPDENIINVVLQAAIDSELLYRQRLEDKKGEALKKAKKAAEAILGGREEPEEVDE